LACAGKKAEGAAQIERTLDVNPAEADAYYQLAKIEWSMGEFDSAMSKFERFFVMIDNSKAAAAMAKAHQAFRESGLAAWSQFYLDLFADKLQNQKTDDYFDPSNWIWIYMSAGDVDNAFKWLNRACDDRESEVLEMLTHPFYERLWADPRFELVLKRMGLEKYRRQP
jgi:tetratricopeptide (TPR) repeat protein